MVLSCPFGFCKITYDLCFPDGVLFSAEYLPILWHILTRVCLASSPLSPLPPPHSDHISITPWATPCPPNDYSIQFYYATCILVLMSDKNIIFMKSEQSQHTLHLDVLFDGLLHGMALDLIVEVAQPVVGVHAQRLQQLAMLCKHVLKTQLHKHKDTFTYSPGISFLPKLTITSLYH